MSALCLYSCGNYTDEPDGVCIKCRGYSKANKVLDSINIKGNNTSVIPAKAGIQVKPTEVKSMAKKQCDEVGCTKRNFMKGVCYSHFIEKYGRDALPESMRKGSSGTKIVGGGKVKKQAEVKVQAEKTPPAPDRKTTLVKSSDEINFTDALERLITEEVDRRTGAILNIVRKGLDDLREDLDEWEKKHAA